MLSSISFRFLLIFCAISLVTACGGGGNNDGGGDPPDPIDMSGTWQMTLRATNVTGADCDLQNNQEIIMTAAVTQTADTADSANLTAVTHEGARFTGAVNLNTGAFTLNGSNSRAYADLADLNNPPINWTADITVTGTVSQTNINTGTDNIQVTEQLAGTTICTFNQDIVSGSRIYQMTGNEDFNGLYAIEMLQTSESSEATDAPRDFQRNAMVVELEIDGNNIIPHLPTNQFQVQQSISNVVYEADTGFFSFQINEDLNLGNLFTEERSRIVSGLFLGDPTQNNGNTIMRGYFTSYRIQSGEGSPFLGENVETRAFARKLTTQTMTRTIRTENAIAGETDYVLLGFANPSMKKVSYNEKLKFQVLDLNAAQGEEILCEALYYQDADVNGRFFLQLNMPHPDDGAFRGNTYSTINCVIPIDQVTNNASYTLRKLGSGTDGTFETTGIDVAASDNFVDTVMTANVAPVGERYTTTPLAQNITVGGFSSSTTATGAVVPLHGFINPTQPLGVSWTDVEPAITDAFQLRLLEGDDIAKLRYGTTTPAYTLPAGSLGGGKRFRVVAINRRSGNNAQSYSRRLEVLPGIRGIFNIEMDVNVTPDPLAYKVFQVYVQADGNNAPVCNVQNQAMLEAKMSCSGVVVDYTNNTVTLNMLDIPGGLSGEPNTSFDLVLQFAGNNSDVANATVSSPLFPSLSGVARAVNTEIRMRTILMSDATGATEATQLSVANPVRGDLLTALELRSPNGDIQFRDGVTTPIPAVALLPVRQFYAQVINGVAAQATGLFYAYRSSSPLADQAYLIHDTAQVDAPPILHYNYNYQDPSNFVTPTLDQVTIVFSATSIACGNQCTSASPLAMAASNFDISWTIPTPTIPQRWQLVFTDEGVGAVDPQQIRTLRRVAGTNPNVDPITFIDNMNGTTTYTWNNRSSILVQQGSKYKVEIRVTEDANDWLVGGRPQADQLIYLQNVGPL